MEDIIKIIKSFEQSGLLIKGTLVASMLGSALTKRGVIIWAGKNF